MKAKSYKLKYVPTVQQLRDAGFRPGGSWMHENAFMFAERRFAYELSVSICFFPDLGVWDDFYNILVLDEEFGQPYTPFYSENYKKDIKGFPVLEYCIRQYNDFLDSFDFLEQVKEDAMVVSDVASLAQWEEAKIHILLRPEYAMMGISLNEAEEGVLLNIYSYFIREHLRKRREGKE